MKYFAYHVFGFSNVRMFLMSRYDTVGPFLISGVSVRTHESIRILDLFNLVFFVTYRLQIGKSLIFSLIQVNLGNVILKRHDRRDTF